MLSRQTAEKTLEALKVGNAAASKIYASLNKSRGTLSASVHKVRTAEVKELKLLANNVCKKLVKSFNNVGDINKAMGIDAVNKLLADAAEMRLIAEILDEVLEESDELAQLPDVPETETVEDELAELDEVEETVEDELAELDEVEETVEDELAELDEMDELEASEVDVIDPDSASDDIVEEVSAKRNYKKLRAKSARAVKANSNGFGFNWNFGKSGR